MHSPELSQKVAELAKAIRIQPVNRLVDACTSMGPGCLFDDMENIHEIKGAIKVFDWILKGME